MVSKAKDESTTETAIVPFSGFDETTLRELVSFEDALALLMDAGGVLNAADEIGDGFNLLDDKNKLINSPLLIMSWSFHTSTTTKNSDGEFTEYVVAKVYTQQGNKYTITDGSTGIYRQLLSVTERTGKFTGMAAPKGLRKSEYDLPDGSGKGTTFYIDNSA